MDTNDTRRDFNALPCPLLDPPRDGLGGMFGSARDSVAQDEAGLKSAALLAAPVAEVALKLC